MNNKMFGILVLALLGIGFCAPGAWAAPALLEPQAPIEISPASKRFDLMAVDSTRRLLLAAHSRAGTLSVVDLIGRKPVAEIRIGRSSGIAVDGKDGTYFVGTKHGVAVIDRHVLDETGFIPTPGPADAMIYDARAGHLYVGHDDGKALWVIDAHRKRIVGTIAIPGAPELMGIDPRTHRLYLNIKPRDEVVVIDTRTNRIVARWPTPHTHSPHGLALDLHDRRLFVAGRSPMVSVFSLPSGQPLKGIDIGPGRVDQIAYDAGARRLYCPSSGRLVVIGVGDGSDAVLTAVKIPRDAHSVAVDPRTHWVWISYANGRHSYVQAFVPRRR